MKRIFLILIGVFLILQFFPIARTNPSVTSEIQVSPEIKEVLKRSCYDCHSNETIWPAYSYIFPASLLIAHHVEEGREELNFSEFGLLSERKQNKKIYEVWEQVDEGEMPPKDYLLMHPSSKLSEKDKEILKVWSDQYNKESE
ncbi:heme-binding domain-containing protein [Leptospira terpstrae]|uniref:Heme-binding domain protein n=1 Tax=Leptospira terpstrae serovar Hualin str. LT 11-33 = ATCC 700639 TaxID=1257025 RepID=N1W299_9LEPT|nr:heme-binding domain-containing protein [Leptospira terpstrae]EMY61791.1 heme-binding domain protein [Leptospira terpstrae serovar Hualin str. LT 11-33 = ATCC 700639]